MLDQAANFASGGLILLGAFFYAVGAVGLARMPDVFTRLHAVSVLETLGGGLLLIGMMFAAGFSLVTVKLIIILGVIVFTGPVATHALAQAALHAGVEPVLSTKRVLGAAPGKEPARETPPAKPAAAKTKNKRRKPARSRSKGRTRSSKR